MENLELIKQIIKDNQQEYIDYRIKAIQDKLLAQGIYITNSDLLSIISEVNTVDEETPIIEEV